MIYDFAITSTAWEITIKLFIKNPTVFPILLSLNGTLNGGEGGDGSQKGFRWAAV